MPGWEVIYKATADFAALTRAAREAQADLRQLQAAAKAEADTEKRGALEAAAAHDADTAAIKRQTRAMESAAVAAKAYNQFVNQGGRSSRDQYLSDLGRETQQQALLNRARDRGFYSPQQRYAWQQQEIAQRRLMGYAERDGLATTDQYLGYRDQLRKRMDGENASWMRRAQLIRQNTDASAAHANALSGAHQSAGQIASAYAGLQDALHVLPQDTRLKIGADATEFYAEVGKAGADFRELRTEVRRDRPHLEADAGPVRAALSDARSAAASAFDEISLRGRASATSVGAKWDEFRSRVSGIFAALRGDARDTAGETAASFNRSTDKIKQGLAGIASTSGGDSTAADIAGLGQQLAAAIPDDTTVKIDADESGFDTAVGKAGRSYTGLKDRVSKDKPKLGADDSEVQARVAGIRALVKDLTSFVAANRLHPKMDTTALVSSIQSVQAAWRQVAASSRDLKIQPAGLAEAQREINSLQGFAARSFAGIETSSAKAASGVKGKWADTRNVFHDVFASMAASARAASSETEGVFSGLLARLRGAFSGMGGGGAGVGTGLASAFGDLSKTVGQLASDIPGKISLIAAGVLAVIQLLPALAAGLGALGSVAATLPDFLGAAGGAFITFASAILPVISALQKYNELLAAREAVQSGGLQTLMQDQQAQHSLADAQYSLTQAVVQGANTQRSAVHSVRDAEFSLAQARYQAAQSALTDAHNVAEAQYSLRQSYFAASIGQAQSSLQVAGAYHALQDSQFAVTQAQYQLNLAWQQATFQMKELMLQVDSASLNLRGAQLNLEQAQQNYAQVMAQSTSTALDRAQAAYQIQVAEQALKQVQLQNTENEAKLADVRKYGAKQVFGVTEAQHALVDAQFAEITAQKQLVLTQREAANAQITAAHQVADAVFALRQAFRSQANDALVSAHSVYDAQFALAQAQFSQGQAVTQSQHQISDAQFAVTQAMEQLRLDAQAGGAAAVSAYTALQVALAQLSPAARRAVAALEPLFMWWSNNKAAQEAFFGTFDRHLAKLGAGDAKLIRPLNEMLTAIARVLGQVSGQFLDWFTKLANSPVWHLFTRTSVTIIRDFGLGLLAMADAFTKIAQAAAPLATWIAREFLSWARGFDKWAGASLKPGSMLQVLLSDAKPALLAVGQVLKSIVDFFEILAGGKPHWNKQGILTGVTPSDSQNGAFRTFLLLLGALANTVLPNLAVFLTKLANPQLANALINLLSALSTLLLAVVSAPGFIRAFTLFVDSFAAFVNLLAGVAGSRVAGTVLGDIAGALVVMAALKFSGVLALLTHLGKVLGYLRDIKGAKGVLGKLGAVFGASGEGGGLKADATGASTILQEGGAKAGESLLAAARSAAAALAGGGAEAGSELGAGGATAETELAAGGATAGSAEAAGAAGGAAAGGRAGGGRVAGFLGRAGLVALAVLVARQVLGAVPSDKNHQVQADQAKQPSFLIKIGAFLGTNNLAGWVDQYFSHPVRSFFENTLPKYLSDQAFKGYWQRANTWFAQDVQAPVGHFFGSLLPGWLGGSGKGWSGLWDNAKNLWGNDIAQPFAHFWGTLLPGWLGAGGKGWQGLWDNAKNVWGSDVAQPFAHFWGTLLPGWFGGGGKGWKGLWDNAKNLWDNDIWHPFEGFFTNTVPGWFGDVGKFWKGLWGLAWSHFKSAIIDPVGGFFTRTLPSAIEGAFKSSVNWVINNVINKVIGFINDTVGKIPGVPSIPRVGDVGGGGQGLRAGNAGGRTFASGGPIPHQGGGPRQDNRLIWASDGEFVINAESTRRYRPLVEAINAQQLAAGGEVTGVRASTAARLAAPPAGPSRLGAVPASAALLPAASLPAASLAAAQVSAAVPGAPASAVPVPRARLAAAQASVDPMAGAPAYASGGEVYRNPLRRIAGLSASRVDMGVDYGGRGWLYAVGPGVIRQTVNAGWPGGGYIDEQLTSGPYTGKHIYQAEDITPRVRPGQRVDSGTPVGYLHGGMEIGFGDGRGGTMAQAYNQQAAGGDPGEHPTAFGVLMDNLLKSLGAPGGTISGPVSGRVPRGWPTVGSISFGRRALRLFGSIFGGLGGFAGRLVHDAEAALKAGALKSFNWLWGHTVQPLEKHFGLIGRAKGSLPGNLGAWALDRIHRAVTSMLSTASAAQGGGPTSASARQAQRYARSQFGRYGWSAGEEAPLVSLWNRESGWNRFAQNPSSGAYGIPQALPPTKLPKAGQPASLGGQSAAGPQIDWGENYIKGRYGTPSAAWAHEQAYNWYASGGEVGRPAAARSAPSRPAPSRPVPAPSRPVPAPARPVPARLAAALPSLVRPVLRPLALIRSASRLPAQPAPAQPAPSRPVPAQLVLSQLAAAQPAQAQPVFARPAVPVLRPPVQAQPVLRPPVPARPALDRLASAQSALAQPVSARLVPPRPAPARPVLRPLALIRPFLRLPAPVQPVPARPALVRPGLPAQRQPAAMSPLAPARLASAQSALHRAPVPAQAVPAQPSLRPSVPAQLVLRQLASARPASAPETQPAAAQPALIHPALAPLAPVQPAPVQVLPAALSRGAAILQGAARLSGPAVTLRAPATEPVTEPASEPARLPGIMTEHAAAQAMPPVFRRDVMDRPAPELPAATPPVLPRRMPALVRAVTALLRPAPVAAVPVAEAPVAAGPLPAGPLPPGPAGMPAGPAPAGLVPFPGLIPARQVPRALPPASVQAGVILGARRPEVRGVRQVPPGRDFGHRAHQVDGGGPHPVFQPGVDAHRAPGEQLPLHPLTQLQRVPLHPLTQLQRVQLGLRAQRAGVVSFLPEAQPRGQQHVGPHVPVTFPPRQRLVPPVRAAGGPVGEDQPDFSAPSRPEPRRYASYPVPARLVPPAFGSGGEILPAVRQAVPGDSRVRESMLLGSWLESRWNPRAVGQGSYGPWQIQLSAHPGVTIAQAESPPWAARYMAPAYKRGVAKAGWGELPFDAEQAAFFAERPRQDYYASQGTPAVDQGWRSVQSLLGKSVPPPPPGHHPGGGHHPPRGAGFTGAWRALAGAQDELTAEFKRFAKRKFHRLRHRHHHAWEKVRAERAVLESALPAEERAWRVLAAQRGHPAAILPSAWTGLEDKLVTARHRLHHDSALARHEPRTAETLRGDIGHELEELARAKAAAKAVTIPGRGLDAAQAWDKNYQLMTEAEASEEARFRPVKALKARFSPKALRKEERHEHRRERRRERHEHHAERAERETYRLITEAVTEAIYEQARLVHEFALFRHGPAPLAEADWHKLGVDTTDLLYHLRDRPAPSRPRFSPPPGAASRSRRPAHHPRTSPPSSPVVRAVLATTVHPKEREAMLLGSWLESRWDESRHRPGHYGPFQLRPGRGITKAEARSPAWSARHMLPRYRDAITRVGRWDTQPFDAERAAVYADRPAHSYYASQGARAVEEGWHHVTAALRAAAHDQPGPGHHRHVSHVPRQGWRDLRKRAPGIIDPLIHALEELRHYEGTAHTAWGRLPGSHKGHFPGAPGPPAPPSGHTGPPVLPDPYALIGAGPLPSYASGGEVRSGFRLAAQPRRPGLVPALGPLPRRAVPARPVPAGLRGVQELRAIRQQAMASDPIPPGPQGIRAGRPAMPSGLVPPGRLQELRAARPQAMASGPVQLGIQELRSVRQQPAGAGPASFPAMPGGRTVPPAHGPFPALVLPPAMGLRTAGQAMAAGPVPAAQHAAIPDIFSFGAAPVRAPSFTPVPQVALAAGQQPVPPRTMSEAGAAGAGRPGNHYQVESIVVNNPVPERAGESLTHATQKLSFLAGRGIV